VHVSVMLTRHNLLCLTKTPCLSTPVSSCQGGGYQVQLFNRGNRQVYTCAETWRGEMGWKEEESDKRRQHLWGTADGDGLARVGTALATFCT